MIATNNMQASSANSGGNSNPLEAPMLGQQEGLDDEVDSHNVSEVADEEDGEEVNGGSDDDDGEDLLENAER